MRRVGELAELGGEEIAHVIVTEYGMAGGLVACGVVYATGLVMDRYNL